LAFAMRCTAAASCDFKGTLMAVSRTKTGSRLLPIHPRNRSGHGCPRTRPVSGWNWFWEVWISSSVFPFAVAAFLFGGHFPCAHRIAIAVGKLDDHADQISARFGLPLHVYRILTLGFSSS